MNPKREILIALSIEAKFIQETQHPDKSINQILIDSYATRPEQVFRTFKSWIKNGFVVKEGEKAFLVWGKKLNTAVKTNGNEPEEEEDENFNFYPISYVFSDEQVKPLKK